MQETRLAKAICHCCKLAPGSESLVPCKTAHCDRLFCHRCLTSRYKYSRTKVAKLPTVNWRCPFCADRCKCDECARSGRAAPIKKRTLKWKELTRHYYKKRRIRKRRSELRTGLSSGVTSERAASDCSLQTPRFQLPPISGSLQNTCSVLRKLRRTE
eukprot:TRINITY_DN9119_c0_g1_i4.p2 TRINITY_DN9119_c0_g1~~TRINITY_DN9119_c0_g1_i4.p2  ORF type:complete len:157 (+),score=4.96 TRINITY_DN9119_c0_g1_i4:247-717(+)